MCQVCFPLPRGSHRNAGLPWDFLPARVDRRTWPLRSAMLGQGQPLLPAEIDPDEAWLTPTLPSWFDDSSRAFLIRPVG